MGYTCWQNWKRHGSQNDGEAATTSSTKRDTPMCSSTSHGPRSMPRKIGPARESGLDGCRGVWERVDLGVSQLRVTRYKGGPLLDRAFRRVTLARGRGGFRDVRRGLPWAEERGGHVLQDIEFEPGTLTEEDLLQPTGTATEVPARPLRAHSTWDICSASQNPKG